MRIGIGCTTYNRPAMLAKFYEQIKELSSYEVDLYIAEDTDEDRRGVAYRKNECLRALQHCDHIFLFDDDAYPIKRGWEDFFIKSGNGHLLFLSAYHNKIATFNDVEIYADCGGVFMYMTKEVVEKVGAFNESFTPYAFEHAEYTQRIHKTGLQRYPYSCLKGTSEYLYSEDYSNPHHKSCITKEEKNLHIKNNWDKFIGKEIENLYLPL